METIYWLIVTALAGLTGWLAGRILFERRRGIPQHEVDARYIAKDLYAQERQRAEQKEAELRQQQSHLAAATERIRHLEQKVEEDRENMIRDQELLQVRFKNLANELLDEKSRRFVELNEQKVSDILKPLREKIQEFEKRVEETHKEETRERISLKKELEQIVKLNQQVSEDATRLTNALRGDKKMQGDWGEAQLELILERAGLQKDIHYLKQQSFTDDAGKTYRPDYVILLPEDKHLVLDSKVSLVAYNTYFNAETPVIGDRALKEHIQSLRKHIEDLGTKAYQQLYGISAPDYVLLFVPIEPALSAALREEPALFERALEKNVVLVSVSTLLATLRTISYIWKQENQKRNVHEIAKESGALYDKFAGFLDDMQSLGKQLAQARGSYDQALNKLYDSPRRGDTVLGRMERLRDLGARSSKQIPRQLLDRLPEE